MGKGGFAMIPHDFIEDLLARTDIVDLIEQYLPLKKGGANYMACCPFHKEKSPSFSVSPSKQFYHCFGCGAHGSAIGFLMEYQGVGFVEAVQMLADRVGMTVPNVRSEQPEHAAQRLAKKQQQQSLEEMMQAACQFYQRQLPLHQEAISYLNQRDVSPEMRAHYAIGYAPDAWQTMAQLFPDAPQNVLMQSGLLVGNEQGRVYDRFRHRVMFPIRSVSGQVIGFGGRVLDDSKPKYLNSPDTPLFDKGKNLYGLFEARAAIRENGRVLVVEGYMDVVGLAQFGVPYAVATLGTATTAEQIKLLFHQTDNVYFCFDGDEAGRKAAWRALENALPQLKDDKSLHFLFLPAAHDPDSFVREFGKARFEEILLHQSQTLSQYFWAHLLAELDLHTQEGKAELVKTAAPLLNQIQHAPTLAHLLKQDLSEKTGIDLNHLSHLMGQNLPRREVRAQSYHLPRKSFRQPESATLVQKQIRALLFQPKWAEFVDFPDYFPIEGDLACLVTLADFYRRNADKSGLGMAQAIEFFRETPFSQTLSWIIRHLENDDDDSEAAQENFMGGMARLTQQVIDEQLEMLKRKTKLNPAEQQLLLQLLKR